MKKRIAVFMAGFVLAGTLCYAGNGDMVVNGNLGVGTSAPLSKLEVNGDFGTTGRSDWLIGNANTFTGLRWILRTNTDSESGSNAGSNLEFISRDNTGNYVGTVLKLTRTGNVGIGTPNPQSRLEVNGDFGTTGRSDWLIGNANTFTGLRWILRTNTDSESGSNAGSNLEFISRDNTGNHIGSVMKLMRTGTVLIGTTTDSYAGLYNLVVNGGIVANGGTWHTSDERYKKNITPVQNALSTLLKMEGVSYEWKKPEEYMEAKAYSALLEWQKNGDMPKVSADGITPMAKKPETKNFPEGRHYGVLAQAIEKVLPEVVRTDDNGDKAVAYSGIIPVLIEAVKEQQAMITGQQTMIASLQTLTANQQKLIDHLQKQQDELRQLLVK